MEKQYEMTVRDIPGGLLTCLWNEKEIGIQEFSPEHVVLRFVEIQQANCEKLQFAYFALKDGVYKYCKVSQFHIEAWREEKEYVLLTIEIEDAQFAAMVQFVITQYEKYIRLKMNSMDNTFSEELAGYPANKDEIYAKDFNDWVEKRTATVKKTDLGKLLQRLSFELALPLENKETYQAFLREEWSKQHMLGEVKRLYIGNAYCPLLFPQKEQLLAILEKARQWKLQITIVLSYLRQSRIEETKEQLQFLYDWCCDKKEKIEIVINDYGQLLLVQDKTDYFILRFGTLLNKRRKDPRYCYKCGFETQKEKLMENSLQDDFFLHFLEKYQISGIEYETCGYEMKISTLGAKGSTLQLPLYQTNTSQFCPTYALCTTGDRGVQSEVKTCPGYCERHVCLYPEHLSLIGRYTSVFAFDEWLMTHSDVLQTYKERGVTRILWNMWDR